MTPADLLFILVVLWTAGALVYSLSALLRRRGRMALRVLWVLGGSLAVYGLVVAVVAVAAPQRVLRIGEDRCFDDMCFAPFRVRAAKSLGTQPSTAGEFYVVDIRIANHGRRRAQREAGVNVSLLDPEGRAYGVSAQGQRAYDSAFGSTPELTSRLQAGETVTSVQVFDVPRDTSNLALHFGHDGPGAFIIGDDQSPLHKPTITPLPRPE